MAKGLGAYTLGRPKGNAGFGATSGDLVVWSCIFVIIAISSAVFMWESSLTEVLVTEVWVGSGGVVVGEGTKAAALGFGTCVLLAGGAGGVLGAAVVVSRFR